MQESSWQGSGGGPELSPEDRTRFAFLLGQIVGWDQSAFRELKLGVGASVHLEQRLRPTLRFLSTPGGKTWWAEFAHDLDDDFATYLQARIDALEGTDRPNASSDLN